MNSPFKLKSPLKEIRPIEELGIPETKGGTIGALGGVGKSLFKAAEFMLTNKNSPRDKVKANKYANAIQEIQPFELKPDNSPGNQDIAPKKAAKCWKGYVAKGKKKSPSRKKTKGGKIKMVNNCVKK